MAELYIGNTQISGGGGSGSADLSNYYTKSHIDSSISALDASCRTYAPVEYTTLDDYNDLVDEQTVDENKLYVITDLADADDLADFVTLSDLDAEKQNFNTSLGVIANSIISTAQSEITSAKNTAVSLVQAAAQEIPNFVIMTASAYSQITPDSSTIYFITE